MGRRTIGPASCGLGEGLEGRDVFVPSGTSNSCSGLGAAHADTVARCTVFLRHIGAAGFRVNVHCGLCLGGRMALDLHLSRVHTGVSVMRQDFIYQLDTTKW
jgi:hypothetical protein